MEKDEAKAKLAAYLDPDLPESERVAKEMIVLGDAGAQAELDALGSVDDQVKALPAPEPPEGYFDALGKKLDERIAEESQGGVEVALPPAAIPAAWAAATAQTSQEPDRTSGISNIKDLARHTVKSAAVPEPIPTASELSGMAVRSSVVGIKVDVPVADDARRPKWLPMAVGAALVLVAAVGVMGWKLLSQPEPSVRIVAMEPPPVAAPVAPPVAARAAAEAVTAPASEPAGAAVKADDGEGKTASRSPARRGGSSSGAGGSSTKVAMAKGGAAAGASADRAAAPAEAAAPKKSGNELDDLLEGATKTHNKPQLEDEAPARKAKAEEPAEGSGEIGINDVRKVLEGLQPKMRQCFKRFQIAGTAEVSVIVAPTGKLTNSSLKGDFLGTPTGTCVLAQVKTASFPKFKGSPMSITFPFNLH